MASAAISEIVIQSANLRAELKEWERAFAAQNGGRKAERNDIKKVPEIAAKYKEYSRLKALESSSGNADEPKSVKLEERPKKRKHTSKDGPDTLQDASTPRKTAKGAFETPSKHRISSSHPSQVDPYISPTALRRLFSPSTHRTPLKTAIGPTPQRDGKALGLFDLLSESGGSTATPSADRVASVRTANVQTPSKRRTMDTIMEEDEEGDEESPRPGRTPASSGKKWMLSALFATPTTLRYSAMVEGHNHITERNQDSQGTANDVTGSETPSFLRRSHSARYATAHSANTNGLSPIAVRKPPQFIGKGLSAIVQGLRNMEEERLEDELDVLHEIEAEQAALNANVEVGDSQTPAGNIGRPWKKKGQKRTTRRVRMKPVISKPTSKPQGSTSDDGNEHQAAEEDVEELAAVPETQQPQPRTLDAAFEDQDENSDQDDQVSLHSVSEPDLDSDPDYGEDTRPVTKSKSFSEKMKEAIGVVQPQPPAAERPAKAAQPVVKEDDTKKVRARKVNPQAHANYRSLKIRNKNSKGRGAGRFRGR